jgi:hypothetical protein
MTINTEKKRIQVDVTSEVFEDLNVLKESSGTSMTNVFKNALKLYKFVKDEERKKSKLIVEESSGEKKQIIIP